MLLDMGRIRVCSLSSTIASLAPNIQVVQVQIISMNAILPTEKMMVVLLCISQLLPNLSTKRMQLSPRGKVPNILVYVAYVMVSSLLNIPQFVKILSKCDS